MSEENVELIRWLQPPPDVEMTELFQRDAADPAALHAWLEAMRTVLTEDFVCSFHTFGDEQHHGAEGLREVWLDWLEPWESYRTLSQELIDLGDRVLVLATDVGRRHGMAEAVEFRGGTLWTIRDGKVAEVQFFPRLEDALAAAGVDAPSAD